MLHVEVKRILDAEKMTTVQEATERVGISRSSFYKYKDDIQPFHEQAKGRTVTFILQMDDTPGILSDILKTVADFRGNILTIHQSIPINGIATLTLSVEILPEAARMFLILRLNVKETGQMPTVRLQNIF